MRRNGSILLVAIFTATLFLSPHQPGSSMPQDSTTLISKSETGEAGDGHSYSPVVSGDKRYVAYESSAKNILPGDTDLEFDIYVYEVSTGNTVCVSVASDGTKGNNSSTAAAISQTGRFVAFMSGADNLDTDDTNNSVDFFVHDRDTDDDGIFDEPGEISTELASVTADGQQGTGFVVGLPPYPVITPDGRFIAFYLPFEDLVPGDANEAPDVFVKDMQTGELVIVSRASDGSQANNGGFSPDISADGRFVIFGSWSSNLGDNDTNGRVDVFLHDRDFDQDGIFDEMNGMQTIRVSVSSDGTEGNDHSGMGIGNSISASGNKISYHSAASNLVDGDTNGNEDVFVYDVLTHTTTRASVSFTGTQGDLWSVVSSLSADGSRIAFGSGATNLVPGDINGKGDIFVKDLTTGEVVLASVAEDGTQGNQHSGVCNLASDGTVVYFDSNADNLVPDVPANLQEIYERQFTFGVFYTFFLPLVTR